MVIKHTTRTCMLASANANANANRKRRRLRQHPGHKDRQQQHHKSANTTQITKQNNVTMHASATLPLRL
eukprot:1883349-Rhodomonas_salina.5